MVESAKYKVLALISGGMDSTFSAYWCRWQENYEIVAGMFVNYGQKGAGWEWAAAKKIMDILGIEQSIYLDASSIVRHLSGSIVSSMESVDDPHRKDSHGNPASFVPGRNCILLSLCLPYVYRMDINTICGGWNSVDVEYPDCTQDFLGSFARTGSAALGRDMHTGLSIVAPSLHLTKTEEIAWARDRGFDIPWEKTRSCYSDDYAACGRCDSCLVRAKAFYENGMVDPLYGRLSWDSVLDILYSQGYMLGLYEDRTCEGLYEGDTTVGLYDAGE